MNVYDFDNTIYRGDSTADLVFWLLRKRPASLRSLPRTAWYALKWGIRGCDKLTFKTNLYHMFTYIPDMEALTDEFVASHLDRIKPWYREQQKEDDMIISASPEFLIGRFCKAAGIRNVMASKVDIHTGVYDGINCHGKEKVRRFRELYPDAHVEEFYSDSRSDTPLAELADRAYLVKGDKRTPW